MDRTALSQLRACVEKPAPGQEMHAVHSDQKLAAAFYKSKLWPEKAEIKIEFLDEPGVTLADWTMLKVMENRRNQDGSMSPIDPIEKKIRGMTRQEAFKTVVKERIQPLCDLKFTFVSPGEGMIRVGFDSTAGSWSLLGTDCLSAKQGEKTLNMGWMDAATIMHEMGHVLGMIHEHNNPDGNQIEWNKPVVYAWAKETQGWDKEQVDQNILNRYAISQLNTSKYDPKSIMLYFFPAKMTLNNKGTDINQTLSPTDKKYIEKMYPLDGSDSSIYPYILVAILLLLAIFGIGMVRRRRSG
jgi:hypothetical protein